MTPTWPAKSPFEGMPFPVVPADTFDIPVVDPRGRHRTADAAPATTPTLSERPASSEQPQTRRDLDRMIARLEAWLGINGGTDRHIEQSGAHVEYDDQTGRYSFVSYDIKTPIKVEAGNPPKVSAMIDKVYEGDSVFHILNATHCLLHLAQEHGTLAGQNTFEYNDGVGEIILAAVVGAVAGGAAFVGASAVAGTLATVGGQAAVAGSVYWGALGVGGSDLLRRDHDRTGIRESGSIHRLLSDRALPISGKELAYYLNLRASQM